MVLKNIPLLVMLVVFTAFTLAETGDTDEQINTENVLKYCIAKLNSLKAINYTYTRSTHYFSEDYHNEYAGNTFINFKENDNSLGFTFQFDNTSSKLVFNGGEYFELDKNDHARALTTAPSNDFFDHLAFLYNSLVTVRNILPQVAADATISKHLTDTVINNVQYHLLSLVQKNKVWSNLGNFSPVTAAINFTYKIIVDKQTYLPIEVIQSNSLAPADYVSSRFIYASSAQENPNELSWYYSSYGDYAIAVKEELALLERGAAAPTWDLPVYGTTDHLSSTQLAGQYVLLEFWMKNCGYCIAAVPAINKLVAQYKDRGLTVIGVNPADTETDITKFYEKHKPHYQTLIDKQGALARQFGIQGYPHYVLIDKTHKVVYTGSVDQDAIRTIMEGNAQNEPIKPIHNE